MDLGRVGQLRLHSSPCLQVYRNQLKRKKQIGIFYDLTKAYDAINDTLLLKLQKYEVRGVANSLFK
jgi:hypothetical protein